MRHDGGDIGEDVFRTYGGAERSADQVEKFWAKVGLTGGGIGPERIRATAEGAPVVIEVGNET